ncbi:hypothetical protein WAI453_002192 [Rhynchosporium graminicola]
MISDNDLYRLAVFLGSAAMLLIVLYHFLEINAVEEPESKGISQYSASTDFLPSIHIPKTTPKMSGRLDKSLDEIISTQRTSSGRGRTRRGAGRRTAQTSKPVVAAPVGGVRKSTRPTRGPIKVIPTGPASSGEGKVQVSGFPKDISETMIKWRSSVERVAVLHKAYDTSR